MKKLILILLPILLLCSCENPTKDNSVGKISLECYNNVMANPIDTICVIEYKDNVFVVEDDVIQYEMTVVNRGIILIPGFWFFFLMIFLFLFGAAVSASSN